MFEQIISRGMLMPWIVPGVVAALRIPVQMIPGLDVRAISVRNLQPELPPQDVEEILVPGGRTCAACPACRASPRPGAAAAWLRSASFPSGPVSPTCLSRVNNAQWVPSIRENVDEPRIFANSFSTNFFMFSVCSRCRATRASWTWT